MAEVQVGNLWLHSFAHVADIVWSTKWGVGPCGPAQASCTVAFDPMNDASVLRVGQPFAVWSDGVKVFGGTISEMGRDFPRTLHARGWSSRAGDFDALSTNPRSAVTAAVSRGLPWTNATAFPDTEFGGTGSSTTRLDSLLTNWGAATGNRWGVDAEGVAFVTTDPAEPSWFLDASDLDIGVADDGLYTRVRALYVSSVNAELEPDGWATAVADDPAGQELYGVVEFAMDLTSLGLLDSATAASYAQQQMSLLTAPQWLSRVTTNPTRLLSPGGLPAHLPSVRAGQMVRLFNVPNLLGGLRRELSVDVVLGEVEYAEANPSEVTIAPVGLAVRNLADAIAATRAA